jgi:hypothetical protein
MIRFLSVVLLLVAPAPLVGQSFDDSRAVTLSAVEYQRRQLDRGSVAARVFERVVIRVDNLHLGTLGSARETWVARLAAVGGARPIDGPVCGGESGRFAEMRRAECALKQATLYLEVEPPTVTGDSATTRVHAAWLEPSHRSPLIYEAVCLRVARGSTGWVVVRTCGTTST